ncbi:MAG: S1 RNA-binding domain-containing protein [Candidatus Micrarchaeia archaeon]
MKEEPEVGEFVIATIKRIFPYGAVCTLDEYNGMEAFLHISEVAPRWIKNIHEFLKEKQRIVAQVQRYVPEKRLVDISLKRVTEQDRRNKLDMHRKEKRANKLLEIACKNAGFNVNEVRNALTAVASKYGGMYALFEEISEKGEDVLSGVKLDKRIVKEIVEAVSKNIKKPVAKISKTITIKCPLENGAEIIKNALQQFVYGSEGKIEVEYLGAPKYMVTVIAPDYRSAERAFMERFEWLGQVIKNNEGYVGLMNEKV